MPIFAGTSATFTTTVFVKYASFYLWGGFQRVASFTETCAHYLVLLVSTDVALAACREHSASPRPVLASAHALQSLGWADIVRCTRTQRGPMSRPAWRGGLSARVWPVPVQPGKYVSSMCGMRFLYIHI